MPTLSSASRDAANNAVNDQADDGTTNPSGRLVFRTSSDVEVATLEGSNPFWAPSASGTKTANAISDDSNATGGTTTLATLENRNNLEILRYTVGTSGTEIILTTNNIQAGDTVSVTSLTSVMPAS